MIDVQILRGALVRAQDGRTGRIAKVSTPWVRIEWTKGGSEDVDSSAYLRSALDVHENFQILTLDRGWLGMGALLGARPRGPVAEVIDDLQTLEDCGCGCSGLGMCRAGLLVPPVPVMLPNAATSHEQEDGDNEDDEEDGDPGFESGWSVVQREDAQKRVLSRLLSERSQRHYPFKRKTSLGPGPRKGRLKKAGKWDCTCNNYKCTCKGTGDVAGQTKKVDIDPAYKASYNAEYRAWRAKRTANKKKAGAASGAARRAKRDRKVKRSSAAKAGWAKRKGG